MTTRPWGCYERLRPAEIQTIRAAAPVAYIPWGALEWHSYHNPIGLDGIKARHLCEALAAHTGGVVLPPFYVGTDTIKPFKGFKHTLDHDNQTVRTLCRELLEQLADEGFKVLIVLTGHYGTKHVDALVETAEAFVAKHPELDAWALAEYQPCTPTFEPNHAARGETSFLLLFEPDLVDLSKLPRSRRTTLDDDGVAGEDPRQSSREHGQAQVDMLIETVGPRVETMLQRHLA